MDTGRFCLLQEDDALEFRMSIEQLLVDVGNLFLVMQQALIVLERAMKDDHYLYREADWARVSFRLVYTMATWKALSGLPESPVVLQIDLFMLPAPVKEKGKRGHFPFVLLIVDKENGMVVGMSMITPHPDLHSIHELIPQMVLEELVKPGSRPSETEIRSDLLHTLLDEVIGSLAHSGLLPRLIPGLVMSIPGSPSTQLTFLRCFGRFVPDASHKSPGDTWISPGCNSHSWVWR